MVIGTCILIITLNVNGLNAPTKRNRLAEWIQKQDLNVWFIPGGSDGQESACNAGDLGSMPGLGRSPGEGKGYPLQYSDLEKSMDCIAHGVAKSRIQLNDFHLFSPRNTINCAKVNYRMGKVYFHHLKPSKISYPDYKMKSYSSTKDL